MEATPPEHVAEPVFRAHKRRKVIRKRADSSDGDNHVAPVPTPTISGVSAPREDEEETGKGAIQAQKKTTNRKHGIAFSSNPAARRQLDAQAHSEMSLVTLDTSQVEEAVQSDRFVKPTGKAGVVEDKHMVAYIDSKLARLRGSPTTLPPPPATTTDHSSNPAPQNPTTAPRDEIEEVSLPPHHTPQTGPQITKPPRPRRGHKTRAADDIARDAIIDTLMRESQVPHYSSPSAHLPHNNTNTNSNNGRGGGQEVDNDTLAAEAFKAQFLQDMAEQHQLRRKPAPSAGAGEPSKPKLGGSRQQRERMKAYEEAQAAEGKGKK